MTSADVSQVQLRLEVGDDPEYFLPNPIIPHRQMRFTRNKYQMKKLLTFFAPSDVIGRTRETSAQTQGAARSRDKSVVT